MLDIGPRREAWANTFTLRVATPKGLSRLNANAGILATRPLLIMKSFDFHDLWAWIEKTVASCERDTWLDCVGELRLYFSWEYEGIAYRQR